MGMLLSLHNLLSVYDENAEVRRLRGRFAKQVVAAVVFWRPGGIDALDTRRLVGIKSLLAILNFEQQVVL